MWAIYDQLINSIPEDLTVLDCMFGLYWTLVCSESGTGTAMTVSGGRSQQALIDPVGWPLKKLAAYIKSWNMLEASLGLAAINAALNTPAQVSALTGLAFDAAAEPEAANGFARFMPEIQGKNVAVIGHFPNLEDLKQVCRLTILERAPQDDDYPDPACEYLLPEQDVVFISGTALINKTMPRLLELAQGSRIILIGPSVPISPVLFGCGAESIASTVILDQELVWRVVKLGGQMKAYRAGAQMVCIQR